jgi:pimeloyl-ACP methyl ester carboxylesterase
MPELARPDGAVIAYTERGTGFPLLALGPALGEALDGAQAPIAPGETFPAGFRVLETDQRRWYAAHAPATPPTPTSLAAHALALLDATDAPRSLLFATGGGAALALRLAVDAPERITAAVLQAPAGAEGPHERSRFWAPFHETIRAVRAGGTAAARPPADRGAERGGSTGATLTEAAPLVGLFEDDLPAMTIERFATLMVRLRDALWPAGSPYFSVSEAELRRCSVPLLVLPGDDPLHSAAIAHRICATAPAAHCLDAGWQEPASLPATVAAAGDFLRQHARS